MFQTFRNLFDDAGETLVEAFWRHPAKFVGHKHRQLRQVFAGLHPSTNVAIYSGVLWVMPLVMVDQYKSLYLTQLGLGAGEMGVYNSLAQLVLLASALAGGYLADAWGRRMTTNVFDALSWALPALLLAIAPNKWFGVAAILFFGFNMAANISYNCLLVEKNPARRRADVYTVLQIVNVLPSIILLPFLAGWWVDHAGLEGAVRWMYGIFFVFVVVGIWTRRRYLDDDYPKTRRKSLPWGALFKREMDQYRSALTEYFKRPASKSMFFSRLIDEWMMAFWALYLPLYMVRHLGLPDGSLAKVNQAAVYVGAFSLILLIPSIHKLRGYRMIGYEQVVSAIGVLVLLFGKGQNVFWVCFFSQGLSVLAGTFFWSFSGSAWANMLEGKRRPRMLAGCYALMRVGVFAGGFLAAYLYDQVSPEAFLWTVLGLRFVNLALLRRVSTVLSPMIEKNGKIEWPKA
jgi:MFS family permease